MDLEDKLDIFQKLQKPKYHLFFLTEFDRLPIAQSYEELVLSLESPLVYYIFSCTVYHRIIKFLTSIIEIYRVYIPPPISCLGQLEPPLLCQRSYCYICDYVCILIKNSVVEITEFVELFKGRTRVLVYWGTFCDRQCAEFFFPAPPCKPHFTKVFFSFYLYKRTFQSFILRLCLV